MKGLQMMFESLGFDPEKIMGDFEALRKGVTEKLTSIDTRMGSIESRMSVVLQGIARIEEKQEAIWTANQTALRMSSQLQVQPNPQPLVPLDQNRQPQLQQVQPNPQPQ